jgi:hypothetical protein
VQHSAEYSGVYFFHIPKTAGMSIWRALESAYEPESICPYWLWDQLVDVPRQDLARYRVFRGHFYAYLEPYLGRQLTKFTVLREPVERTISYYYYIRELPEHPNHLQARTLNLREFCLADETRYLVENYQSGYMASFAFPRDVGQLASRFTKEERARHLFQASLEPSFRGMDPEFLLEAVEASLQRFSVVGTVENLPLSMTLVSEALGRPLALPEERRNTTAGRPSREEIDEAALEAIYSVTSVDRRVYDLVAARLGDHRPSGQPHSRARGAGTSGERFL